MSEKPIHMTGKEYYEALRQARKEALEEAALKTCWMCGSNRGLMFENGKFWHKKEAWFTRCHAQAIHLMLAEGQTTQAGPVEERKEGYTEQELKCVGCMGPCGQCNS